MLIDSVNGFFMSIDEFLAQSDFPVTHGAGFYHLLITFGHIRIIAVHHFWFDRLVDALVFKMHPIDGNIHTGSQRGILRQVQPVEFTQVDIPSIQQFPDSAYCLLGVDGLTTISNRDNLWSHGFQFHSGSQFIIARDFLTIRQQFGTPM